VAVEVDGLGPTLFVHGSPRSDEECVTEATPVERVAEFMHGVEQRVIVTAHTHVRYDRRVGDVRLLNPGSVGLPYEGERGVAFWALLGPDVRFRRTEYDLDAALERLRASGMSELALVEELMTSPPAAADVIADAEVRVFAG
jgi:diadenosine tetraphosphatase ApaH/serine/threonine PP2A family protein phosphatase